MQYVVQQVLLGYSSHSSFESSFSSYTERSEAISRDAPAPVPGVRNQSILPICIHRVSCYGYRQPRVIVEMDPVKSAMNRHKWVLVETVRRVVAPVDGRERQWA